MQERLAVLLLLLLLLLRARNNKLTMQRDCILMNKSLATAW